MGDEEEVGRGEPEPHALCEKSGEWGSGGVGEWVVVCGSHVDNVDHLFFFGDRASTPRIDLFMQNTQNLHIPVEIRTGVEYVMKKSSRKGRIGETMEVQE